VLTAHSIGHGLGGNDVQSIGRCGQAAWRKALVAIRLTRRCERGARMAALIALGHVPGTARLLPSELVLSGKGGPTLRAPRTGELYTPLVEVLGNDSDRLGRLPRERSPNAPIRVLDVGAHVGAFAVCLAAR